MTTLLPCMWRANNECCVCMCVCASIHIYIHNLNALIVPHPQYCLCVVVWEYMRHPVLVFAFQISMTPPCRRPKDSSTARPGPLRVLFRTQMRPTGLMRATTPCVWKPSTFRTRSIVRSGRIPSYCGPEPRTWNEQSTSSRSAPIYDTMC